LIEINHLKKSFSNQQVLKGIDLKIESGGIFAVLGPNGSGKTTILKCILGMVIPNSGKISIDGMEIGNQWSYREKIDYLPQITNFPDNLRVSELIRLVKDVRQTKSYEKDLIERFGLEPYLDKKIRNLSGGTRQKVNVVLAFMFNSPILILDEPTAGLDPVALIHLKELIDEAKKAGKTILFTTHIMTLVEELSDEIVFLLEGKIYFRGTLEELSEITKEPTLERSIAHILRKNNHQ